jgi:L-fucose mutarotase
MEMKLFLPMRTFQVRLMDNDCCADGLKIPNLLDAILPLFALDTYVESPLIMMCAVSGDQLDPLVEASYRQAIDKHWQSTPPIQRIDRFDFYDRTKQAFAVL